MISLFSFQWDDRVIYNYLIYISLIYIGVLLHPQDNFLFTLSSIWQLLRYHIEVSSIGCSRDLNDCKQLISLRRIRYLPEVQQVRALMIKGSKLVLGQLFNLLSDLRCVRSKR